MLGNTQAIGKETGDSLQSCRPDPEDMLQKAKARKEKAQQDINGFMLMDTYYTGHRDQDVVIKAILGEMHMTLHRAECDEIRWLDEIDKD